MSNLHAAGLGHVDPVEVDERELRILTRYAKGLTDVKIARDLGVSRPTISQAGTRMRRRIGANNRAHAVAIAYETGILKVGQT